MGDGCRVYSTPNLLCDIEMACRDLLLEHIEPGKDSVGTRVGLDHVGATLIGMWVEVTVTLVEANGGAVPFDFTARDAVEEVARGKHSRFIVGVEKTAQGSRPSGPRRAVDGDRPACVRNRLCGKNTRRFPGDPGRGG